MDAAIACRPDAINYRANIDALKRARRHRPVLDLGLRLAARGPAARHASCWSTSSSTAPRRAPAASSARAASPTSRWRDPVCPRLHDALEAAARGAGIRLQRGGTYLAMEGPQFSTPRRIAALPLLGLRRDRHDQHARGEARPRSRDLLCDVAMVTDYDCWHPDHDGGRGRAHPGRAERQRRPGARAGRRSRAALAPRAVAAARPAATARSTCAILTRPARAIRSWSPSSTPSRAACSRLRRRDMTSDRIKSLIRTIPDHPKPGILFRDITTLLAGPAGFSRAVRAISAPLRGRADRQGRRDRGARLHPRRRSRASARGRVRRRCARRASSRTRRSATTTTLEYGTDRVEIHTDAIATGERVLLVDDLIATGGTALASVELIAARRRRGRRLRIRRRPARPRRAQRGSRARPRGARRSAPSRANKGPACASAATRTARSGPRGRPRRRRSSTRRALPHEFARRDALRRGRRGATRSATCRCAARRSIGVTAAYGVAWRCARIRPTRRSSAPRELCSRRARPR